MKPRRTLLVVINKKVEWGILSVADIAVKWVNFRLHRSGGPRGTELAACDALAKALDYLPLALDQAAVYMAARAPASASPVICACWANPILLDQLSPSALRLPRADGVLTGQLIFVDFAVSHDNAKISVGFFEGPDVSKASPSARAPSSAIKVDLLNTTPPTPVRARTPAARNTGALP